MFTRRQILKGTVVGGLGLLVPLGSVSMPALAQEGEALPPEVILDRPVKPADRAAAARAARMAGRQPGVAGIAPAQGDLSAQATGPVNEIHYFGPYPNYANSPVPMGPVAEVIVEEGGSGYSATPTVTISDAYGTGTGATASATVVDGVITAIVFAGGTNYSAPVVTIEDSTGTGALAMATIGGALAGGIRRFVDGLPGLTFANRNNLGQYIPVAIPDTTSFPGADYYEIELGEYSEKLHTDLPPTRLRGYRQTNTTDASVSAFHYLGPMIVSHRDRPVRIKFTNSLPTGAGGNLFLPVDPTVMGAGMGPLEMPGMPGMMESYTQNRGTIHLHGAFVPWISDGTPHQWTTPAGEMTQYPKGVSVQNVPDMEPAGPGTMTFYYNNQQSARLQFYHDHSWGITRLNVYAGEAAGYIIRDDVETDLVAGTNVTGVNPTEAMILPADEIPLMIQDRTFVDAATIYAQDPTWRWGTGTKDPATGFTTHAVTGDLWLPSVYVPAQNPWADDLSGTNPFGRWQYGPWFWPPTNIMHGPVPNEYYDGVNPWEPPYRPQMPDPSMGMEAFMDTPLVNGTAYPYLEVEPKAYRFRILSVANDRFFNLAFYLADPLVSGPGGLTELEMVPATAASGLPASWPKDARDGGVPAPSTMGPNWVVIGNEGGFLPAPVVVEPRPIVYEMDVTLFNVGNVVDHSLLLAPAERADVIVDFSLYAGQTLILANDAPAAFPANDPRYDYYTGKPDLTGSGGTPTTQPGYGPNTHTLMQIRVANTTPAPAYNVAALEAAFAKTASKHGVFEVSQDPIIVPQAAYNTAYNQTFSDAAAAQYVTLFDPNKTFNPVQADGSLSPTAVTVPFEPKAIQDEMGETFDKEYGRMSGMLGLEMPTTVAGRQNFMLYPYSTPPVDIVQDSSTLLGTTTDGIQIWRITQNGVDTHPMHVHLFNVQVLNRVAWDGQLLPPHPIELGWKETFRVNPLQHAIVALKPKMPTQPFEVPNSIRYLDPSMPPNSFLMGPPGLAPGIFMDPAGDPVTVRNIEINFGWEYVWHCHILSHEEMDMMHPLLFAVKPAAPTDVTATVLTGNRGVRVNWTDNSVEETAFRVERHLFEGVVPEPTSPGWVVVATVPSTTGAAKGQTYTYTDRSGARRTTYVYRVIATNVVGYSGFGVAAMGAMSTEPEPEPEGDYGPGTFPSVTVESVPSEISNEVTTEAFLSFYMPQIAR